MRAGRGRHRAGQRVAELAEPLRRPPGRWLVSASSQGRCEELTRSWRSARPADTGWPAWCQAGTWWKSSPGAAHPGTEPSGGKTPERA